MAFDYNAAAADAQEIIAEFGATWSFTKQGRTPADTNKPWRGPNMTAVIPATPDADEPTTITAMAAVVPIEADDETRSIIKGLKSATAYVAQDDLPGSTDLTTFDVMFNSGFEWRIVGAQQVNPTGARNVVYILHLEA